MTPIGLVEEKTTSDESNLMLQIKQTKSNGNDIDKAVRKPLGDRTNKTQLTMLKSSMATIEDNPIPIVKIPTETLRTVMEPIFKDEDEATTTFNISDDGFVIWEDQADSSVDIGKDGQINQLREALSEALEENRQLHAELALAKIDQKELDFARNELAVVSELYEVAKKELEGLRQQISSTKFK